MNKMQTTLNEQITSYGIQYLLAYAFVCSFTYKLF